MNRVLPSRLLTPIKHPETKTGAAEGHILNGPRILRKATMIMGYHTNYFLTVTPMGMALYEAVDAILGCVNGYFERNGLENNAGSWLDLDDTWYNHEEDMLAISKQFPELLFVLEGEGENNDDLWKQYFRNGKTLFCPAYSVYWPFIEARMKSPEEAKAELEALEKEEGPKLSDEQRSRRDMIDNSVYQCILAMLNKEEKAFPWDADLVARLENHIIDFLKQDGLRVYRPTIVTDLDGKERVADYEEGESRRDCGEEA